MSNVKKKDVMLICFNNVLKSRLSNYLSKNPKIKLIVPDKITTALQLYIKSKPDIIFFDPFFAEDNIQGVDVLVQLKNNNTKLEKPVKLYGIAMSLNPSIKKILDSTCDYIFTSTNLNEIDNIFADNNNLQNNSASKNNSQEIKVAHISSDLSIAPFKTLIDGVEYKDIEKYKQIILNFNAPSTSDDPNEKRDEKRARLLKVRKGFWDFYTEIAKKYVQLNEDTNLETVAFLRFRSILTDEWNHENVLKSLVQNIKKNPTKLNSDQNVFYADEWLKLIYIGKILPTYNDLLVQEFRRVKGFFNQLKNLKTNSEENYYNTIATFLGITFYENAKKEAKKNKNSNFKAPKNEKEIIEKGKMLLFENEITEMFKAITNTCIGPQGNKQPFLNIKNNEDLSFRIVRKEQVLNFVSDIEKIDPNLFKRIKLNEQRKFTEYHVIPYFILVPCQAKRAICWDPWHDSNKRNSPGRVAIPILPEMPLFDTILEALGSLRWRTAKQTADIYWMEEGLTGGYYQYWEENRAKFDDDNEPYVASKASPEESFVIDYIKWIKFESKAQLKLRKEVRDIFWFNVPFSDEIKQGLKGRGQIYEELLERDKRRMRGRFAKKK